MSTRTQMDWNVIYDINPDLKRAGITRELFLKNPLDAIESVLFNGVNTVRMDAHHFLPLLPAQAKVQKRMMFPCVDSHFRGNDEIDSRLHGNDRGSLHGNDKGMDSRLHGNDKATSPHTTSLPRKRESTWESSILCNVGERG